MPFRVLAANKTVRQINGNLMQAYEPIQWDKIHAIQSFAPLEDCWKRCDSYCCKTNHKDFQFRFIRCGQVQLPMCPDEHRYLERIGKLQSEGPSNITTHSIEFLPGKVASVYMMRCETGGICKYAAYRPLICKIYPYLPVPSPDGSEIEELALSSVFDVAHNVRDGHIACPARRDGIPDIEHAALQASRSLFEHPHLIFYFRIANGLMQIMARQLRTEHAGILDLPVTEYFQKWEVLYMTGKLLPQPEIRDLCAREYRKVSEHWGDFNVA